MPILGAATGARAAITPLIIGTALLMQGLEGTAIATALPAMAQGFGCLAACWLPAWLCFSPPRPTR